jgi:CBS domain-containing protein
MVKIEDIMTKKVITIDLSSSAVEAAQLTDKHNIGSVVVTEAGNPVGMLTERDMVRRVLAQGRNPSSVKVSEIMSKPLISISPSADLREAVELMVSRSIRRLPVIDNGRLVGIITSRDVIRHMKERELRDLDEYLSLLSLRPEV